VLEAQKVDEVVESVLPHVAAAGFEMIAQTRSPLKGAKGNVEVLAHLRPRMLAR